MNNGITHQTIQHTPWFDKALEGQPNDIKARVLEIVLKFGVDIDDPFFLILTAIGQLQALIESSPKDWQNLFTAFQGDLHAWSIRNNQVLELIARKAETTEMLSQTTQELTHILTELVKVSHTQILSWQTSARNFDSLQPALRNCEQKLIVSMEHLQADINKLSAKTEAIRQNTQPQQRFWSRNTKPLLISGTIAGIAGTLFFANLAVSQSHTLQQTAQQVEWLLRKANRQDCLNGIKPPKSPECQGL